MTRLLNPPPRRMRGASAGVAGGSGYVPTPAAGDQDKLLHGDATFRTVSNASAATEAEALAGTNTTKFLTPATGNARVLAGTHTRAIRDCIISDGATSGRELVTFIGETHGNFAALGIPVVIPFSFDMPTANPAVNMDIVTLNEHATLSDVPHAFQFKLLTGGELFLRQYGATTSDWRQSVYSAARTAFSGRHIRGYVVPAMNSTTLPIVVFDGTDIAASFGAQATNGTVPNWMPPTMNAASYVHQFRNAPAGRYYPHAPILGTFTTEESLAWTQTGRLPRWCEAGVGSLAPLYSSDFSASVDGWTAGGGTTLTGGINGVNGQNGWLRLERTSTTGQIVSVRNVGFAAARLTPLSRIFVTLRVFNSSATTRYFGAGFGGYSTNDTSISPALVVTAVPPSTQVDVTIMRFARNDEALYVTDFRLLTLNSGATTDATIPTGDHLHIRDVKCFVGGPLFLPVLQGQGCAVATDSGANRLASLLRTGMSAIGNAPEIIAIPIPNTTADGFIHADQVIVPSGYEAFAVNIERVTGASTGTITIRETSSGGTTIASGTLAANVLLTISNPWSAADKKLHLANSAWSASTISGRVLFRRFK
ncbi:MAG: hypothetical protein Q8M02_14640 [Candidatus Didemnitutus sp.]|nr:hypothetical protein [Candidatus Didemnitutus sp.]